MVPDKHGQRGRAKFGAQTQTKSVLRVQGSHEQQGVTGWGAPFVLSVILVSQVKSYYRARGREKERPRTVLSLHGRVWSPESWCGRYGSSCSWHSGSQCGGGDLGEEGCRLSWIFKWN